MRCEFCGGRITLEMSYCPYCGNVNEHARQHVQDMQEYLQDYEETKYEVQEKAHRFTGITVRVFIIAVLAMLITLFLFLGGNVYSIKRGMLSAKAERNAETVMQQMDTYLEEEDFIAFIIFCDENYIDTYETVFEAYYPIERSARGYQEAYNGIMQTVCPPEYMDTDQIMEALNEGLDYFYRSLDRNHYVYFETIDWEKSENAMVSMEKKIEVLLQSYCGLTEEEAQTMKTLSRTKRAILLEEAILNE